MDAVSMLGGERSTPLDLTGLSPEEIRGVSAGRISRDQIMNQAINQLMGFQKMKSTMATQEEARKSSEAARMMGAEKLRQLKAGDEDMTITGPDGKPYGIKRRNLTESLKYVDMAKHRAKQGELADEQIKKLQEVIPMKIKDASGKEETYPVSATQFPAVAKAIEAEKESTARTEALDKYRDKNINELSDMSIADFAILGGTGGIAALANRVALAGDTIGLSDAHYRHYANLHVTLTDNILGMKSPDEALVNTVNDLSRRLHTSHMMLRIKDPSWFALPGATKAVTVLLPPNVTADMVYKEAENREVSVSEILQNIYERTMKRQDVTVRETGPVFHKIKGPEEIPVQQVYSDIFTGKSL